MSQHDYILADQAGAAFLADTNAALAAIVSNNSGATEPTTTYPYQWWADTTAELLKVRDSANSAWINVAKLSDFSLPSVQTQLASRFTAGGTSDAVTGTLSPAITAYTAGLRVTTSIAANTIVAPTLNLNSLGVKTIKKGSVAGTKAALVAGDYNASRPVDLEYDGTDFVLLNPISYDIPAPGTSGNVMTSNGSEWVSQAASAGGSGGAAVRQTVSGGPIDSSGFPNLAGSTGSTSVTTSNISSSAPLAVVSSNGFNNASGAPVDRFGFSTSNLTFSGLSTNGTMYLYVDVASNGALTPGVTTLAPVYQWGGTRSVVSGQATYNIQEGYMSVGNGSTAVQTYRVFVGEVTVAGGVVTAITWYAYNGRYSSGRFSTAVSTSYTKSHNLGVVPMIALGYASTSGGALVAITFAYTGAYEGFGLYGLTANAVSLRAQATMGIPGNANGPATSAVEALIIVQRGW